MNNIKTAPKDRPILLSDGKVYADGYWLQGAYNGVGAWIWPYVHKTPTAWCELPKVGAGETAVDRAPDIHAELTMAAFYRELAK